MLDPLPSIPSHKTLEEAVNSSNRSTSRVSLVAMAPRASTTGAFTCSDSKTRKYKSVNCLKWTSFYYKVSKMACANYHPSPAHFITSFDCAVSPRRDRAFPTTVCTSSESSPVTTSVLIVAVLISLGVQLIISTISLHVNPFLLRTQKVQKRTMNRGGRAAPPMTCSLRARVDVALRSHVCELDT